jgi:hypothetical protein
MWSNNDGMDPNWKPYYPPQVDLVGTLREQIINLRNELDAACRHVEALCLDLSLYRVVADRAREFEMITSTSNRIALVDALKELDEARRG